LGVGLGLHRWALFCCFILSSSWFDHISVLPNLLASSAKIGEVVQAMYRQSYWYYLADTAEILGTTLHPAFYQQSTVHSLRL
jgi:hypothetical protein